MARRRNPPGLLETFIRNAVSSATSSRDDDRCVECRQNGADRECDVCGGALHSDCEDAHPCFDEDETENAISEYTEFHWGNEPDQLLTVELDDPPRALVAIGKLVGVIYETAKGKRQTDQWIHHHDPKDQPILCYDPKSPRQQLYIVGGKYRVTKRGIED